MNSFVIKGDVCYSENKKHIKSVKDGYLVCINGISRGVFASLPEQYEGLPIHDYSGKIVIPGLVDLHIHAPQYAFRGMAMDLELIDWLNNYAFPEEAKYADTDYADKAYGIFAKAMQNSATTHAVIFATRHIEATEILMDKMEQTGIVSYVGKINMDRHAIPELQETGALDSAFDTFKWINGIAHKYKRTFPILTPRFIPSCSDELMNELLEIQKTYDLPVQSHLSENKSEIEWVKSLCPEAKHYSDAYARWGLFGGRVKTVMAHCVYSCDREVEDMRQNGVFVAHCPESNVNLSSGIAPVRRYVDLGLKVGLGSDIAAGCGESMLKAATEAVKASKMYWRLIDNDCKPLTFDEAFYLATVGGGDFFGKVGSFDDGYSFSAVVLDDGSAPTTLALSPRDRLERAAYLNLDSCGITAKYVLGQKIKRV